MNKFLRIIISNFYLFLSFFIDDLNAVKVTEAREAIFIEIESEKKYPNKIFDIQEFLNDLDNESKLEKKPVVEMDLSNDPSLNSKDVRKILVYFRKNDINLNFLNIAKTNIEEDILQEFDSLLINASFKHLDISGTPAAESSEKYSEKQKIIFIAQNILDMSRRTLEKTFGMDTINRHTRYYETTKSFVSAWDEGKFEGLNLRRVTTLMPDKDNELTPSMQEDFLNSYSLTNLRTLSLERQGINNEFIGKLCNNVTFARIMNLDLRGNKDITDASLDFISNSPIIGSVRDLQQISSRYSVPSSEIYITTKGTSISEQAVNNFRKEPQNKHFTIRYLHPIFNTSTNTPPANNAIKWLQVS